MYNRVADFRQLSKPLLLSFPNWKRFGKVAQGEDEARARGTSLTRNRLDLAAQSKQTCD